MELFKLGKDKDTGKIKTIDEVEGGLACNCVCPNCGEDLVAAHGEKTEWYFRHNEQSDCNLYHERGLLALAQEILSEHAEINLPFVGKISYGEAASDKKNKKLSFTPELTAKTEDGKDVFFNILVTDTTSVAREKAYKSDKLKSVEIDLGDYQFESRAQLEKDLLSNAIGMRMIYWDDKVADLIEKAQEKLEEAQKVVEEKIEKTSQVVKEKVHQAEEIIEEKTGAKVSVPLVLGLIGAGVVLGALALTYTSKRKKRYPRTPKQMLKNPKKAWEHRYDIWEDNKGKIYNAEILDKPKRFYRDTKEEGMHLLEKPREVWESSRDWVEDNAGDLWEDSKDRLEQAKHSLSRPIEATKDFAKNLISKFQ